MPLWHVLRVMTTLDDYMTAHEITDQSLADKIGVSRPYITRIRNRKRQPSLPVALKLAEETKLPAATFMVRAAA